MPLLDESVPAAEREIVLHPFRALRHRAPFAAVEPTLLPPGGASPEQLARLRDDPLAMIHVVAPPAEPGDRSRFVRFARASARLARWRRDGTLAADEKAAVYAWRGALFGLILLDPAPVATPRPDDPLRRLEATLTHVEAVPIRLAERPPDLPLALVEEGEPRPVSASPVAVRGFWPSGDARYDAARAFAGADPPDPRTPAAYALAVALPPGVPPPPIGGLLWSHADFGA